MNRGLGTEALALWVDYLFANSSVHRLGLDSWSFNSRMKRVAEKVGFVYEGAQREMIEWQGRWLDWMHYGLLRGWEKRRGEYLLSDSFTVDQSRSFDSPISSFRSVLPLGQGPNR